MKVKMNKVELLLKLRDEMPSVEDDELTEGETLDFIAFNTLFKIDKGLRILFGSFIKCYTCSGTVGMGAQFGLKFLHMIDKACPLDVKVKKKIHK